MFSKSIRTTVKYEAPQTHNWNCRRKTGRLNINKVPELNYDQDGSANTTSGERTGVLQVLPLLILRWFIAWLPHTSAQSNICGVSASFSFPPGSSRIREPFSLCICVQPLSLARVSRPLPSLAPPPWDGVCGFTVSWDCHKSESSSGISLLLSA